MSNEEKKDRIILLTEWDLHHPWPKLGTLREFRAKNRKRGSHNFFIKADGRVLVDEKALFAWLDSKRGE